MRADLHTGDKGENAKKRFWGSPATGKYHMEPKDSKGAHSPEIDEGNFSNQGDFGLPPDKSQGCDQIGDLLEGKRIGGTNQLRGERQDTKHLVSATVDRRPGGLETQN